MIVREAIAQDVPALMDILNALIRAGGTTAIEEPLSSDEFRQQFLEGNHVICCHAAIGSQSMRPVGLQMLGRDGRLRPGEADIATFAQSQPRIPGVGTALFATTKDVATAHGITAIIAQIRADNRSGLAYYDKMGFRTFDTLRNIPLLDGTPIDRVLKRYDVDQ